MVVKLPLILPVFAHIAAGCSVFTPWADEIVAIWVYFAFSKFLITMKINDVMLHSQLPLPTECDRCHLALPPISLPAPSTWLLVDTMTHTNSGWMV
jgi:hypothetical protein